MARVAYFGTGYVGLVNAAVLADFGHDVTCVDIRQDIVNKLNEGKPHFYEPGLEDMVRRNVASQRLRATTDGDSAASAAEYIFVAVPTPQGHDGAYDLQHVNVAVDQIAKHVAGHDDKVVILKSTVPPLTTASRSEAVRAAGCRCPVVFNPEFLREGSAVDDACRPDRIVVGVTDDAVCNRMATLYEPFLRNKHRIIRMTPVEAELVKGIANAYLAMRVSFFNEVALICDKFGADVEAVKDGVCSDTRIGQGFNYPGIGWGGSCFPKDVLGIIHACEEVGHDFQMAKSTFSSNERQKGYMHGVIRRHYDTLSDKVFAVWGLAFKKDTDDVRDSPSLHLIRALRGDGAQIQAYDREANRKAQLELGNNGITYCNDMYAAATNADGLIVATDWGEYRNATYGQLKTCLKRPVIFDGRNQFDPRKVREAGFEAYYSIGRNICFGA